MREVGGIERRGGGEKGGEEGVQGGNEVREQKWSGWGAMHVWGGWGGGKVEDEVRGMAG